MNPSFALKAVKILGATIRRMDKPVQLSDYQRKPTDGATHEVIASFEVDGRRFRKQSFLLLNIAHDVFISTLR